MDPFTAILALDNTSLHVTQSIISQPLTGIMLGITFFGNPVFWVLVAALVYWKGKENESFFLMNLIVFTAAIVGATKLCFARPRPSQEIFSVIGVDSYGQPSFPSGHSTLIAGAFSYAWRFLKRNCKVVFAVLVILVAFSRIYLGMHFLSDVLAGIAIGLAVGKLNLLARNRLFHLDFKPSKLEEEIALVGCVVLAIIAVIFLQPLPLSAALIGFYAGFFLFKETNLQQLKDTCKKNIAKNAIGITVLGTVLVATGDIGGLGMLPASNVEKFAIYFFAGFWISWLWPVLWEKTLKKQPGASRASAT